MEVNVMIQNTGIFVIFSLRDIEGCMRTMATDRKSVV